MFTCICSLQLFTGVRVPSLLYTIGVRVTYNNPDRPRKTKIGTEVAHFTRDSDTTFKVNRSKANLQGAGHIVAASRTACYLMRWSYCLKTVQSCAER